jgi:hypothetical protein
MLTKILSIYYTFIFSKRMVIEMLLNIYILKNVQMILHFQKKLNVIMYIIENKIK